jgi:uncharacterized protein (TIGR00288 family)
MHNRHTPRTGHARSAQPLHRGPQAAPAAAPVVSGAYVHAPHAALLIDFDNVTLGIQKDLGKELRALLSSEIIKGKVSVQRAYADWRRYPQYVVSLAESSIDMIMAPAYGSSKKNATDIRLAIDAMELVFTRPEIGTFILLSGDSDFSSLVMKLKEYGKYVIGVGIRESASDLLVQNCDEYYSYNSLAGLSKSTEDDAGHRRDPWELVAEAIERMQRNGDVMRSDRLKQVMQELDPSFDEKDLGYSKFSRFCTEAASKGLLIATKLENGQLEVAPPAGGAPRAAEAAPREAAGEGGEERRGRRGRRGGRGRNRDRGEREREGGEAVEAAATGEFQAEATPVAPTEPARAFVQLATPGAHIGAGGERLTRDEAFDLVRRAVAALVSGDTAARASAVREKAYELLGRDSESLSERNFPRILRDAHDAEVVDLRRRGDDFEVAMTEAAPVADQLAVAASANAPAPATNGAPAPRGMAPRGAPAGRGGRGPSRGAPPPDLFAVGVIEDPSAPLVADLSPSSSAAVEAEAPAEAGEDAPKAKAKKGTRAKTAKKKAAEGDAPKAKRASKKKAAASE